ncbi:MAG: hypothetical protein Q9166_006106 [cf. Caloplaca sp. 2 TL-2023]
MFYFGGVQNWKSWLDNDIKTAWASVHFTPLAVTDKAGEDTWSQGISIGGVFVTPEILESVVIPLQSNEVGMSPAEKFNLGSAACARYIDWAIEEMHDRRLTVKKDHRAHWWKVLQQFVESESGRALIQQSPNTKEELDQLPSKLGIEGEAIAWIGPELVRLLTGQTNPLFHILKDDLLFRLYLSDEGARPNRYVADYTKILTSQRKKLRIFRGRN